MTSSVPPLTVTAELGERGVEHACRLDAGGDRGAAAVGVRAAEGQPAAA